MPFCESCGGSLLDDFRFCPFCGQKRRNVPVGKITKKQPVIELDAQPMIELDGQLMLAGSTEIKEPLKVLYCYARKDKRFCDELDKHLSNIKRKYRHTTWSDLDISPGSEWQKEIDTKLKGANLILLLISPDFMASDDCYSIEMRRAIEWHKTGAVRVIPIILRQVDWKDSPFSILQVLPTNARPIDSWQNRDEAYLNIVQGISQVIEEFPDFYKKHFEQALALYMQEIIPHDPNNAEVWYKKGIVLFALNRDEEALLAFEQAIRLDADYAEAGYRKGNSLLALKRYEEALDAYNQAVRYDPNNSAIWNSEGTILLNLRRYEEALNAYNQAIHCDSNNFEAWYDKGSILSLLKRNKEALLAFEQAIRLNPNEARVWHNKGVTLEALKRHEEALDAFNQAAWLAPHYEYLQSSGK